MTGTDTIVVLDFDAASSRLLARRVREAQVFSEILPGDTPPEKLKALAPRGIILGGPGSNAGAPRCHPGIFHLGIPVLAIGYGIGRLVQEFGGEVAETASREDGAGSPAGVRAHPGETQTGEILQIIKEKPDHITANEEFGIVDEVTKVQIINNAVDEWKRGNERRLAFFIDEQNFSSNKLNDIYKSWHDKFCGLVLGAIGDFKCRGIGPQEARQRCSSLPNNSFLKCASEVYEIYDRKLKILGFLDFDDMLYNSKKILLEDASLLEKYQKKYTFVCEDEAQDSNLIQSEILTMLANGNLLRVGDSNQAILRKLLKQRLYPL